MNQAGLEVNIQKNKVEALIKSAFGSATVGSLVAIFLSFYLKDHVDKAYVYSWCAVVIFFGVIRILLSACYQIKQDLMSLKSWTRFYYFITICYAATWASISLVLIGQVPPSKDPVFVTILLGLSSGGGITHISSKVLATFYSTSIVLCHSIKTLIEGNEDSYLLVGAEILFVLLLIKLIKTYSDLYNKSQAMSIELQDKLVLEQELQEQKVAALQKSKLASLGEMAAGMAHEVNNPLTISMGKLEIVNKLIGKMEVIPPKVPELIISIIEANKRAAAIVNSIRNLSRMKDESEFQQFNIDELLVLVKPLVQLRITRLDVEFIEEFENFSVYADMGEVSQVLLNLINNSLDALKDVAPKGWIRISTEIFEDQIMLKVTDSGLLTNLGDMVKIFEPFYTTKDIGEGTGLGLSVSRSIMQRNGGTLTLDTSGPNTCFVIGLNPPK